MGLRSQVLSWEHCWNLEAHPGAAIEPAVYVNAVAGRGGSPAAGAAGLAAVTEGPERRETLGQGEMTVADVACAACGVKVGWRFKRALGPGPHGGVVPEEQEGR